MENKKKVHMICNAHIDPLWQWDLPEGVSATLSTFYSAVKLCYEFDYIFCHNEVTVYKYVEEYAPSLFKKIQELVKLGKWHIMGGWYLQPDCNMPMGESFVRQIREGQRYFLKKFGVCPSVAVNLDPFGHSVGLVQIIKKCGQDSYLFMRPFDHELVLPNDQFIWKGLDGSTLKATRINGGYSTHLGSSKDAIKHKVRWQSGSCVSLWGVGNHGGGPSKKDLEDIERELLPDKEVTYIHSTPKRFFEEIEPTDIYDKSLHISMPGCYTSMYRVKKLHAQLENEISLAEKISSCAYMRGLLDTYPENEIQNAVTDLLNAEFHDILPGSSVQCAEEAGLRLLNHGMLEAERAKLKAYFALSKSQEPARDGEYPIVVFNPHPYELTDNVECEFSLADQNWNEAIISSFKVKNEKGEDVKFQVIKEESNLSLDWRKRIIFEATLKPFDVTRFSVYVEFKDSVKKEVLTELVFDNGRKRVEIDKETGLLKSYKINGCEYLKNGFGLCSLEDNADPWGMGSTQLLKMGGNEKPFVPSIKPRGVFEGMKTVQVIENGDIYLGVEAFFECDNSLARILYKIYKNSDDIDIDITLFMGDINKIIKLKVPLATDGELIGQAPFGTDVLYKDGKENVAGRFVALDTGKECVALLNKGVYGSHFENGCLYMSLTRGVTYCAHPIGERELIPLDRFTKKIDQGENSYSFRLTVTDRNRLECKAMEFYEKPYGLNIFPLPNKDPSNKPFEVLCGTNTVSVATIKKEYGTNGIIFRLVNNVPYEQSTYIKVNEEKLQLSFGKYEVKTLLYKDGELTEHYEMLV